VLFSLTQLDRDDLARLGVVAVLDLPQRPATTRWAMSSTGMTTLVSCGCSSEAPTLPSKPTTQLVAS
jgi:hypothetical protein